MQILSPVKNYENLKVAIQAGADAVYFSGSIFGARANARNSREETKLIVEYAKTHYVKIYVTLNTIIFNDEIDLFIEEINFFHSIGVDAIIVQDYAFIPVIKAMFNDLEVHCSTQMNINNSSAISFVKKLGASRVVVPRESNLEQIAKMSQTGIELEVFVHGALCTSYSGLCLISSVLNQNSGNRGLCNQICRMPLSLVKNGKIIVNDKYLLSLKDLNVYSHLTELEKVGVHSLKIEGRLKQKEYVALTTFKYKSKLEKFNLNQVYNRTFTTGYLTSSNNLSNIDRVNNNGYYVGKVIKQDRRYVYIKASKDIRHLDKIRYVKNNFETGQTVDVIETISSDVVKIKSNLNNLVSSEVYIVNSSEIRNALKTAEFDYYSKNKKAYDLEVTMELNKPLEIICLNKKYYSISNLEQPINRAVSEAEIIKQLSKTNDYPFDFNVKVNYKSAFISLKELNNLRRNIYSDITDNILRVDHIDKSYQWNYVNNQINDTSLFVEVTNSTQINTLTDNKAIIVISDDSLYLEAKDSGKLVYKVLSSVIEDEYSECFNNLEMYDGVVVSELGSIEMLKDYNKPIIANYTLNCTNVVNQQFLLNYCDKVIVDPEVGDIEKFDKSKTIGLIYGHLPLMTMKYCPINKLKQDKCGKCKQCINDNYAVNFNNKIFKLKYQNYDKINLMSHLPLYNAKLLKNSFNLYIKLDDELNTDEVLNKIKNNKVENFIDNYQGVK